MGPALDAAICDSLASREAASHNCGAKYRFAPTIWVNAMNPTVTYDPDANAAYIRFSPEPVEESEEVSAGIILDYDADGRIAGMEVMDARAHLSPELLTKAA